jgi:hypothetical protein
LKLGARRVATLPCDTKYLDQPNSLGLFLVLGSAAAMSSVLAVTAWFALMANDEIFYSRLLPWIGPLIWLQETGFRVSSRMFPCRVEGSGSACEPYKWLSAFLVSNALAYFPFVLAGTFIYPRFPGRRLAAADIFRLLVRWGAVLGAAGLVVRLCLYRVAPEFASPIHAWDAGRVVWTGLDYLTGILALALALLVPFCSYRALRAIWSRRDVLPSLIDLTWLASFGVVVLTLAYQFRT